MRVEDLLVRELPPWALLPCCPAALRPGGRKPLHQRLRPRGLA